MEGREHGMSTRDLAGGATAAEDRERSEGAIADETPPTPREATATNGGGDAATAGTAVPEGDVAAEGAPTGEGMTAADDGPSAEQPGTGGGEPSAAATTADVAARDTAETAELLPQDDNDRFQRRWEDIQTRFVDDPRQTVEQADELVAELMQRLAEGFAAERERLEQQWGRGEDISTEDLRVALQRYRAFFQRLLSA